MTAHEQREHDAWQREAEAYQRVREAEDLSVPFTVFMAAMDAWRLARREYLAALDEPREAAGEWVEELTVRHVGPVQRSLGL